jgi:flavin-binding protein dodecin
MVFGASNVVGEIKDAIDRSFETILRIEQHEAREIKMVEKGCAEFFV